MPGGACALQIAEGTGHVTTGPGGSAAGSAERKRRGVTFFVVIVMVSSKRAAQRRRREKGWRKEVVGWVSPNDTPLHTHTPCCCSQKGSTPLPFRLFTGGGGKAGTGGGARPGREAPQN